MDPKGLRKSKRSAAREAVLTKTTSSCKHVDWLIEQRELVKPIKFKNRMELKSLAYVRKETISQ